jgi:glycerol-3-phosphate acyltransferase PlsY
MNYFLLILFYLIGSINFAYLVSKFKNIDISKSGSGNPGTSNVMRTMGRKFAVLVLMGDLSKGLLPVVLFPNDEYLIFYCLVAIIGHIFPIFYGLNGGKGVATYVGAYIGITQLNPFDVSIFESIYFQIFNIPIFALVFFLIIKFLRVSAIASLITVGLTSMLLLININLLEFRSVIVIINTLILVKHSENLKRLINGEENKF